MPRSTHATWRRAAIPGAAIPGAANLGAAIRGHVARRLAAAVALLLVALAALATPAAACDGVFQGALPAPGIPSYDPFDPAAASSGTQTATLLNNTPGNCSLSLAFYTGTGASTAVATSGGNSLNFEVVTTGGASLLNAGTAPASFASGNRTSTGSLGNGDTAPISFLVRIPAGQVVAPGSSYTGSVTAAIHRNGGTDQLFTTATLNVSITVGTVLSVNIAGGGTVTTLDFGTLANNAVRSASIQARANTPFKFTATSDNAGVLKLDPNPGDGGAWQVPYTVRINNGSAVTLSTAHSVGISAAATTVAGTTVPIEVTLGNPAGQRAGTYKDVITIKIETGF